jgi:acyl dehydratase
VTPLAFTGVAELEAAVGNGWAQSDWIAITQELVDGFATLTNDRQWIHVDVERATSQSPFGATIAHGFLTLSMLSTMIQSCVKNPPAELAINYGFDRVRFISPVPVGSEIRGRFTPATVKRLEGAVDIGWDVEVELRGVARPAVVARWLSRLVGPA